MIRPWIRGAFLVAFALGVVAIAYPFLAVHLASEAQSGLYRDHWRAPYYLARVDGLRWFLPAASAGAALWGLALLACLRFGRRPNDSTVASTTASIAVRVGSSCVLIALAAYFSHREWLYYGAPCWDGYCEHASMFAGWFGGDPNAVDQLTAYATSDYHANSVLVPLLTGFTSWLTGASIESAYRALCGVASLGTIVMVYRSLLPQLGVDAAMRFPAVVLLATHLFWVRSFLYPQTDAFVMLEVTSLVVLTLDRGRLRTASRAAAVVFVLTAGLFTKLSFLPALAIVPGWRVLDRILAGRAFDRRSATALLRGVASDVVIFVLLPLGSFLGYQVWMGSLGLYAHEFDRMATLDTSTTYHLICMLQLMAIPAVLYALRRAEANRREVLTAAWVALYVASLWYAQTSGWARFYLPVLPLVVALAAPGLKRIFDVAGPAGLWSFVSISALLNYAALALRLYY